MTTIQVLEHASLFDEAQPAAAAFLARCRGRTLDAYRHDLRTFFRWAADAGVEVLEATRPHIGLYRTTPEDRGVAASTIDRRLSTVCGFYRFTHIDGRIASDPVQYVRRPTVHRNEDHGMERGELGRFPFTAERIDPTCSEPPCRGHCRPGTGAASPKCQPATGATLSTMNRVRTIAAGEAAIGALWDAPQLSLRGLHSDGLSAGLLCRTPNGIRTRVATLRVRPDDGRRPGQLPADVEPLNLSVHDPGAAGLTALLGASWARRRLPTSASRSLAHSPAAEWQRTEVAGGRRSFESP
ncbi:MAG: site-specific integrase [Aldersonia sp.]|nr:site-specific integrase [Aldersonia sp.]